MTSHVITGELRISGTGLTHVGRVRERNEDAILLDPAGELWAVADGMGGYGQGDVAASMVVDQLALIDDDAQPDKALQMQLSAANAAVHDRSLQMAQTMGATVVAAMIQSDIAYLAWVGDSRIYLWRQGALRQLSTDHSVVQELIDAGQLTPQAARHHPDRNVVTRALGIEQEVEQSYATLPLRAGDKVLLCSDGLTTCVEDDAIADILAAQDDLDAVASLLVRAALDAGAPDNVSVVLFVATGA